MLDFLLESILSKSPQVARFALKLEACQEACKLDLTILEEQLSNFTKQQELVNSVIDDKAASLAQD